MPNKDNGVLNRLSAIFEEVIAEVIRTVSGISMMKTLDHPDRTACFAGIMPLAGTTNGLFIIKTDEKNLRILTSYMTGLEPERIDASDMSDCIGELANMICGLVKSRAVAAGISFGLSTPFCVSGTESLSFCFKKNAAMTSLSLVSQEVLLHADILLT